MENVTESVQTKITINPLRRWIMKRIILLFSFVFMSSFVTANTKSRDLSGVNPEPELSSAVENKNLNTAFFWNRKKQREKEQQVDEYKERIANCRSECKEENDGNPCYNLNKCYRRCYRSYSKKEGVRVASIGDQNPFTLLEESQDENPIMLAVDYNTCVKGCVCEGGSSSECHRVCEE